MSRMKTLAIINIDINRWYNSIIGDTEELIKIIRYNGSDWCVITYYRGIVVFAGSLNKCRQYVLERSVK